MILRRRFPLRLLLADVEVVRGVVRRVRHPTLLLAVPHLLHVLSASQPVGVRAVEVDAVHGEPPLIQPLIPPLIDAVAGDEVDQREVPPRLDEIFHRRERFLPLGNHREAVRTRHEIRLLRELLTNRGGHEIALDEDDARREPELYNPRARHVQQRVREVAEIHLGLRRDHVIDDKLEISCRAATHADPRLGALHPRHRVLHEQIAPGEERLAEAVVARALRLVERFHVLLGG
eukprot:31108-Pelagococcus_subviridis.AAC.8